MAKQNKPNKTTTKGKDLPESVQWLLDFANIGCEPGNLSLTRISKKITTVKRPPSEPATLKKELFDSYFLESVLSNLDEERFFKRKRYTENEAILRKERFIHKLTKFIIDRNKKYNKGERIYQYVDENGNMWSKTPKGETIYKGNENDIPPLAEIKDFLSKAGISEGGGNLKYWDVEEIWSRVKDSLLCNENDVIGYLFGLFNAQSFVYYCFKRTQIHLPDMFDFGKNNVNISIYNKNSLFSGFKYSHDNTLIQVACAYILDFWHNHRELHQHVRQCKCCGKFWIEAKTRKKYCCKRCEDRFNQASREASKASKASSRKWKKKLAKKEIIDWLCSYDFITREKAEEEYEKEKKTHPNNVASLKAFQKTYGHRTYLI